MSFLEKDEHQREGDLKSFWYLLKFAKEKKWLFFFGILLLVVSSSFTVLEAVFLGQLVEKGLQAKNYELAVEYAIYIIIFEFSLVLSLYIGRKVMATASSHIIYRIRRKMFQHMQKLPMNYYDRQPLGRVVTRMTHDVEGLEEFFSSSMGRVGSFALEATVAWAAILITNFQLGILISLFILPALAYTYFSKEPTRVANREVQKNSSAINAKLSELINGLPVIRIFGLEGWSKKIFNNKVEEYQKNTIKMNQIYARTRPLISFLCNLPLVFLIWYGGHQVLAGVLGLGLFITYIRYTQNFARPIIMLSYEIHFLQHAFTCADRVAKFLKAKTEDEVFALVDHKKEIAFQGKVEFQSLWMSYKDENWVLKDVSFQIQAGEKIGLLGRTGSGKTTTLSLIARLYDYQKGQIFIDGEKIESLDRDQLRSQIGYVSQDVFLFKASLYDNLLCGREMPLDELKTVCIETGFYQVMQDKMINFDYEILDQGKNLSVGERQLLSLTRVLLQKPNILILDEATANIDPVYEEMIQKAIQKLAAGATQFYIAHRLDTLKQCDRLLVFRDGELVEHGSHKQLLQSGTYYRDLLDSHRKQQQELTF